MVDSAIRVAVRSRPLLKNEEAHTDTMIFQDSSTLQLQNRSFTFDFVFPPGVSNEAVYNLAVAEKIKHLFDGYNVTILAYGPTGSGKTYTMGTDYNPKTSSNFDVGIIPRGLKEIFRVLESQKDTIDFSVKVSFLELYREEIYDLLQKSASPCNLREDADGGVKVINLVEVPVTSVEDAFITLEKGSIIRHTSATAKNVKSSRSHAIFSIYVEQTDKTNFNFKRAKFQLVDLAGSERMGSSKTAGVQVKEGININLGLLSLGKVITHLIDEKPHIPYRDSKLTRLLQDSLGGNSHTVMIACVNPSSTSVEETLSTLRYASNTRSIKNRPVINTDPPAVQIEKLKKQVESLQAAMFKVPCSESSGNVTSANVKNGSDFKDLHLQLQSSFVKISSLNEKLIELEEKNSQVSDKLKSLYDKIKLIVSELTTIASTNPDLQNHLMKLEEIQSDCLQLMVHEDMNHSIINIEDSSQSIEMNRSFEGSCESTGSAQEGDLEQESLDSMIEHQSLEAITEQQKASNQLLENVERTLNLKEDMARNIQDFFKTYETTVNEDYVGSLMSKIQVLVKEKSDLEESMKRAEKKFLQENQDKIHKYESEIKNLQTELRNKKMVLQLKEENKAKRVVLQKEIQDLKKYKVQLVKQMKEDSNKFMRLQRLKEKEVAKLVREGRKKEFEFVKMKNKFERQMNVLKHKVDQATCSKKKLLQAIQRKTPGQNGAKSKQSFSREGFEEWIEEELKVIICNGLAKVHCEVAEKEASSLTQQIQNIERLSSENPAAEGDLEQTDSDTLKAMLQVLLDKIEDMRAHNKEEEESAKSCIILDGINSMAQAKVAVDYLFKKCAAAEVEVAKQQQIFSEELKKEQSVVESAEEKINSLSNEIKSLKEQVNTFKVEQENETSMLKWQYDSKILHLIAELQSATRSSLTDTTDPDLIKRVEMQEQEIERLQILRNNYENKCKEVALLREDLFKAKKGKRTKWLCDLSNFPDQSSSMEENKSTSMMEEYLSDQAEESFYNDRNDPDWRLTPLHKQMQREKLQKKAILKHAQQNVTSETGETSDAVSPAKRSFPTCECHGECKTMRCRCKKRRVMCSDSCKCDKAHCQNVIGSVLPQVKRKLSLED